METNRLMKLDVGAKGIKLIGRSALTGILENSLTNPAVIMLMFHS